MWQTSERYCNNKPTKRVSHLLLQIWNHATFHHVSSTSQDIWQVLHPWFALVWRAWRIQAFLARGWLYGQILELEWQSSTEVGGGLEFDEFLKMGNMPTGQQANSYRFLMVGHSSQYPGSYDNFADCLGDSFTSYTVLMSKSGGVMVSGQLSSWRIWIPLHKPWPNIAYLFEPLI